MPKRIASEGDTPRLDHYADISFTGTMSPADGARVGNDLIPSNDNTEDLGSSSLRWRNVYAGTVYGTFAGAVDCSAQSGADAGAKLQACITALPSTGGVADAQGLQGAQSVATAFTITKNNVTIIFAPGSTWTWPAPVDSTEGLLIRASNFRVIGNGSIHQATRSLDSGTFFDYFIFRHRTLTTEATALTGFFVEAVDFRLTVTGSLSAGATMGCAQLRVDDVDAPITDWEFRSNRCTVTAPDIGTAHKWYGFYAFGHDASAAASVRYLFDGVFAFNEISAEGRGLQTYKASNIRWIGNTIRNTAALPQFGNVNLRAINTDNIVMQGNSLVGSGAGIYVGVDALTASSESKNVVISGNTCRADVAQALASPSDSYCLRLIGVQDATVTGNVFVNTQGGANGTTDGIKISSAAGNTNKNINITGNRIAGFLRNQIFVEDASSPEDLTAIANSFGDSAAGGANEFGGAGIANLKRYGNYSEAAGTPAFTYSQPVTFNSTEATAAPFLTSSYLSLTPNPAALGRIRMPNNEAIYWRNAANNAEFFLALNTSNVLQTNASLRTDTQLISAVATGTAPLSITSTTQVSNLNVSQLVGATWAAPAAIGTGTPAAGTFTTLTANTSLTINAGTAITKHLSATATLDFANLAAIGCEDLTVSVTGAADGDTVALGIPNAAVVSATSFYYGWVSAADTVTVRYCTLVSGDPPSASFRVDVWKHT